MSDQNTNFNLTFNVRNGSAGVAALNNHANAANRLTSALNNLARTRSFAPLNTQLQGVQRELKGAQKEADNLGKTLSKTGGTKLTGLVGDLKKFSDSLLAASKTAPKLAADMQRVGDTSRIATVAVRVGMLADKLKIAADNARDLKASLGSISVGAPRVPSMGARTAAPNNFFSGPAPAMLPYGQAYRPGGFALMSAADQKGIAATGAASSYDPLRAQGKSAAYQMKVDANDIALQMSQMRLAMKNARKGFFSFDIDATTGNRTRVMPASAAAQLLSTRLVGLSTALYGAYRNLEGFYKTVTSIRVAAFGTLTAGVAGTGAGVSLGVQAGEFESRRNAIRFQLGDEEIGDAFVERLKKFDREAGRVTDFNTTTDFAQQMLGSKFRPDELLNDQGTGIFTTVGDVLGRMGKGALEFQGVMTQFQQAKGAEKVTARDMFAMSTSGGLPLGTILTEGLGKERYAAAISGDEPLTYDEFIKGFTKGATSQKLGYVGGAAATTETLPGKLATLTSAAQMAAIAVGEKLVPAISFFTEKITGFLDNVTAFSNTPIGGFIVSATAHVGLFGAGLLAVGSAIAIPLSMFIQMIGTLTKMAEQTGRTGQMAQWLLKVLTWLPRTIFNVGSAIKGLVTAAVGGTSLFGMAAGVFLSAAAAVVGGVYLLAKYTNFFPWLIDGINSFFDALAEKITGLLNWASFGFIKKYEGNAAFAESTTRKTYEAEVKGGSKETYEQYKARMAAANKFGGKDNSDLATDANTDATKDLTTQTKTLGASVKAMGDALKANQAADGSGGGSLGDFSMPAASGGGGSLPDFAASLSAKAPGAAPAFEPGAITQENLDRFKEAGLKGDKSAKKTAAIISHYLGIKKRKEAEDKKKEAAELKSLGKERVESLGDGTADIDNTEALQNDLAAARLEEKKDEVIFLRERIRRAQQAKGRLDKYAALEKKEEQHAERVGDQLFRERMASVRKFLDGLVKAGKATKDESRDALAILEANRKRDKLGMEGLSMPKRLAGLLSGFGQTATNLRAAATAKFLSQFTAKGATAAYGGAGKRIAIGAGSAVAPLMPWMNGEMNPTGRERKTPMGGRELYELSQLNDILPPPSGMYSNAGSNRMATGGTAGKVRNRTSVGADGRTRVEFEPIVIDGGGSMQGLW